MRTQAQIAILSTAVLSLFHGPVSAGQEHDSGLYGPRPANEAWATQASSSPLMVSIGARVRLSTPTEGSVIGYVTAFDHAAITIAQGGSTLPMIPLTGITSLEVSTGRHTKWKTGALIGFLAGALVWADDSRNGIASDSFGPVGTALSTVVFAAFGTLRTVDDWKLVPLAPEATPLRSVPTGPIPGREPPRSFPPANIPAMSPDRTGLGRWTGARIRFTMANGERVDGDLSSVSPAGAELRKLDGSAAHVDLAAMTKVEVSTGRKSRAILGLLLGGALGVTVNLATDDPHRTAGSLARSFAVAGLAGAITGTAFHRDSWKPIREAPDAPASQTDAAAASGPKVRLTPLLGLRNRTAGMSVHVSW